MDHNGPSKYDNGMDHEGDSEGDSFELLEAPRSSTAARLESHAKIKKALQHELGNVCRNKSGHSDSAEALLHLCMAAIDFWNPGTQ